MFQRNIAKERSRIPVALGYNALILSLPEIYAWRVGRAVPQGDRNALHADRTLVSMTRGIVIQLCFILHKGAESNGLFVSLPRFSYRLLPHFLLPPQVCGSSQGLESLPKTFSSAWQSSSPPGPAMN